MSQPIVRVLVRPIEIYYKLLFTNALVFNGTDNEIGEHARVAMIWLQHISKFATENKFGLRPESNLLSGGVGGMGA